MNKYQNIYLCCDDNAEMVVFTKYNLEDNGVDYEISIKDSYCGGDYKGIKGRFKRAWKAFWAKPVYYTSVYCEDKEKMRKFLSDCLSLIDENDVEQIKTMYDEMNGNAKETFFKWSL